MQDRKNNFYQEFSKKEQLVKSPWVSMRYRQRPICDSNERAEQQFRYHFRSQCDVREGICLVLIENESEWIQWRCQIISFIFQFIHNIKKSSHIVNWIWGIDYKVSVSLSSDQLRFVKRQDNRLVLILKWKIKRNSLLKIWLFINILFAMNRIRTWFFQDNL